MEWPSDYSSLYLMKIVSYRLFTIIFRRVVESIEILWHVRKFLVFFVVALIWINSLMEVENVRREAELKLVLSERKWRHELKNLKEIIEREKKETERQMKILRISLETLETQVWMEGGSVQSIQHFRRMEGEMCLCFREKGYVYETTCQIALSQGKSLNNVTHYQSPFFNLKEKENDFRRRFEIFNKIEVRAKSICDNFQTQCAFNYKKIQKDFLFKYLSKDELYEEDFT